MVTDSFFISAYNSNTFETNVIIMIGCADEIQKISPHLTKYRKMIRTSMNNSLSETWLGVVSLHCWVIFCLLSFIKLKRIKFHQTVDHKTDLYGLMSSKQLWLVLMTSWWIFKSVRSFIYFLPVILHDLILPFITNTNITHTVCSSLTQNTLNY